MTAAEGKVPADYVPRKGAGTWFQIRRFFARITSPRSDGLFFCSGDWCVIYPDGRRSVYMEHGNAKDYQAVFGGTIVWRFDHGAPE